MAREPLPQIEVAGAKKRFKSHSVPESLWADPNTVVEIKEDGHRFKMHIFKGVNRFDSRRESVNGGLFVEKTDNVPYLRDHDLSVLAGTVFDGEFIAGKNSGDVSNALAEGSTKPVTYVVFDVLFFNGKDVRQSPAKDRRALLEMIFQVRKELSTCPYIALIKQTGGSSEEKKALLASELKAGREGVMVKDMTQPYGKGWTKVKRAAGYDVVVMGYDPPEEFSIKKGDVEPTPTKFHLNGWIGAIQFGQYVDGKLVPMGSCSGMDDATRQDISENKEKFVGRPFEMEAQERSVHGKFRHPRFIRWRDDKAPTDCVFREDEC